MSQWQMWVFSHQALFGLTTHRTDTADDEALDKKMEADLTVESQQQGYTIALFLHKTEEVLNSVLSSLLFALVTKCDAIL